MKKENKKNSLLNINAEGVKNALKSKETRKKVGKSVKDIFKAIKGVTDTMEIK